MDQIDLIAVTVGPGLEPALWTGIEFAKKLAKEYKKLLVGANHLEGHLYSFLLPQQKKTNFQFPYFQFPKCSRGCAHCKRRTHRPFVALSFSKWWRLGETRDDAAGEAFDKVARLLDLPYPGGPEIEKLARLGNSEAIAFPRPMLHEKNYDFSFSGLKTAVLYFSKENQDAKKADIAASFQQAAVDVLTAKTARAARTFGARGIILCGGVAANQKLQDNLRQAAKKMGLSFFAPQKAYNFDNAAMIGAAGYMARLRKKKYRLSAKGTLDI